MAENRCLTVGSVVVRVDIPVGIAMTAVAGVVDCFPILQERTESRGRSRGRGE
ncbi:MAG: hypothetical protein OXF02_06215 [Simkaniaceae bacterium]|nr:hypothetical protein [Simkaniaceae bacterium]